MHTLITTINFGGVNCYLMQSDTSYILIDNGYPAKRTYLGKELERAGCNHENLKLVVLTHGDHDHAGNSTFLRDKYNVKIAMHFDDSVMVEQGSMNWNRKDKPDKFSLMFRAMSLMSFFFNPGKFETFVPDIFIDETFNFSQYGFNAKIIHVPGHSKGSIGIMTTDGSLICGDFLYNFFGNPSQEFCDNLVDFYASVEKLKKLKINTFYPGHGKPFTMEQFLKKY
ncbi:MAG: MBL fold metallo-hydrolase [Bacteroidia bacterium]|nr:MBL fold metallo-hydrolase [Bacteroidia bacterium]